MLPEDQMLPIYKDVLGDTDINWITFFSRKGDSYSFDTRSWDEYSKALKEHLLVKDREQSWEDQKNTLMIIMIWMIKSQRVKNG